MSEKISNKINNDNFDEDDEDEDENYEDYEELDDNIENIKIKSLFDEDKWFDDVKSLYKYEFEKNNFNLVEIVKKYRMDMLSYIKMINFIRKTKPSVNIFYETYKDINKIPWNNDDYFQTIIEDDPLLQFDVEEDLHILDLKDENNNQDENFKLINIYENKLKTSESRIEELSEIVQKLRNYTSHMFENVNENSNNLNSNEIGDENGYFSSYSTYSIHLEMLQDKIRTETYMNSILNNKNLFQDKVVLDVGCGTGILSLFCAKAGAKLVIAVDMSDIIEQAMQIAEENGFKDKIIFLKGKIEDVKLPVEKVDIIISEWMGYFLIYESMLDSVLVAREKYLKPNGIVLPNFCEMEIFGVNDQNTLDKNINYWSNVYGFKMNCMRKFVLQDAQIMNIKSENIVTDLKIIKKIDCQTCTLKDISEFCSKFIIEVKNDAQLTGLGVSFNIYFNSDSLENKFSFSTDPCHTSTHWQQTYFQLEKSYEIKKGSTIEGEIDCKRNPNNPRSYLVDINLFGNIYHYRIE